MAETTKKVLEIEIDVDSGDVKTLNKDIDKTAKSTDKAKKGVGGLATSFRVVGTAMKAAGIGLVVALLAKLADVLSENQQVADGFQTAMTALSLAFNDLFKFINSNLGTVTDFFKQLFEDPLGNIKALGNAIKDNLIERFNSFIEVLGLAGKAITQIFEGNFSDAMDTAAEAGKELIDVYTGVDNTFDRVVEGTKNAVSAITDYTKSTIEAASAITEQAKSTKLLELEQQRLREQYDRDAERLRQIRDDDTKSFEERIEANRELGRILNEQQDLEQATVNKRIANLQNLQNQLGFNQERYEEIYALQTELIAIEAQQAGFKSEQLINENSLLREQADLEKEIAKEKADFKIAEEKRAADEAVKIAEQEVAAKRSIQSSLFGFLKLATDLFGSQSEKAARKAFQVQKALGIAEAVINTAKAVNAALAQTTDPTPTQSFRFGSAIAAGIAGALQVATIASTQFGGGGGGSSPNISRPTQTGISEQAPQFNTVGTSGTNQIAASLNDQNNRPVQAYVVAGEVTTAQSLNRKKVEEASF